MCGVAKESQSTLLHLSGQGCCGCHPCTSKLHRETCWALHVRARSHISSDKARPASGGKAQESNTVSGYGAMV